MKQHSPSAVSTSPISPISALLDLAVFLAIMFLIRSFYLDSLGPIGNGLLRSGVTVGTATLLLYYRKQSWKDLGLTKPDKYLKVLGIAAISVIASIVSIMLFEIFIRDLFPESNEAAESNSIFDGIKETCPISFQSSCSSGLNL